LAISTITASEWRFFGKGQAMKHVVRVGTQRRPVATMSADEEGTASLVLYGGRKRPLAVIVARADADGSLLIRAAGAGDKWRVEIRHGARGGRVIVDNPAGDFRAALPLANRPLIARS